MDHITLMVMRIGELCLRAWFAVAENVAVDVLLGTSFIFRCFRGIIPSERKVIPSQSRPVPIPLSLLMAHGKLVVIEHLRPKVILEHNGKSKDVDYDEKERNFTFVDCLVRSRYPLHASCSELHLPDRRSPAQGDPP